MALAERVKELRQNLGWDQATLAKEAGVGLGTISRIERRRTIYPRMRQLQKAGQESLLL